MDPSSYARDLLQEVARRAGEELRLLSIGGNLLVFWGPRCEAFDNGRSLFEVDGAPSVIRAIREMVRGSGERRTAAGGLVGRLSAHCEIEGVFVPYGFDISIRAIRDPAISPGADRGEATRESGVRLGQICRIRARIAEVMPGAEPRPD